MLFSLFQTGLCRWILIFISVSTWTTIANSKEMRVVCYYTNWSVYRPGAAKFTPQNINPYLCTHLIYAFGGFTKDNTLKPFDKYQDIEKGGYAKFTGLKTYNKNLKTMLAIGGWNEGSSRFSPMVASSDRRKELVRNAIKFLRQNHFDGLDLDWEYPSFRDGGKPRDKDNYAQFVQELREEFDRESQKTGRPRLLLTMAVPAGIEYINKGYDVPKLTKYLDWMNILSYDYHSAFEPAVNHHAPLYSLEEDNEYNYDGELNIDYTIKHYLKMGADPSKLVLGIPTYGRSYTLFNPDSFEIGSPADGPGTMGEATRENGYLAYYEICEYIKSDDWEVDNPNPKAMGPYAFKDNQWVGYDDENIARVKAEYVAENSLGGIMFWAIDNDDFRGTCHGKSYPLIEAAKEALLNAYGISDDNLISPTSKPIKSRTRSRTKTSSKVNKADEENETKVEPKVISRRRNRFKTKSREPEVKEAPKSNRRNIRRKDSSKTEELSTYSSLKVVTPSYTTPPPPATPDMGGSFKCEDEGFFPNPKDCKKYFWCLSGAGDSGIVAHQFTCPAGLYFNKAADSCDYSQNVLCNKKLQKATTTTTTSTTESSTTSTDRPVSTTRSIFRTKITTEAYEDEEYEYDDDDSGSSGKNEPEEDPQVIKELIDLIKKAGGIEELEKQLNPSKNVSSSSSDTTTQSAISKALYEKVLSKSGRISLTSRKNTYSPSRNSGGSQSAGLDDEKDESHSKNGRGKLQYTSISRNRPTTTKSADESTEESSSKVEENENESRKVSRNSQLEYVNIRRSRTSTTTEASDTDSRNKILGEVSEEDEDEDEIEDEENESEGQANKRTSSPQYVNIRRQRPSTTEGTTSKYMEIKRGTTEANDESEGPTSKYKTIRRGTSSPANSDSDTENTSIQSKRGSTTVPTEASTTRRYINFRRGSTEKTIVNETPSKSQTVGVVSESGEITAVSANPEERTGSTPADGPTVPYNGSYSNTTDNLGTTERQSTTIDTKNSTYQETTATLKDTTTASEKISTTIGEVNETSTEETFQKKRPQLLDPRPFSIRGTTSKPIIDSTTHTAKVSESNIKLRSRIDEEVGEQQNVPSNIQFRSRSSSRFNFNRNSNTDSRETGSEGISVPKSRRRLITSTEKVFDDNRTFRPSEIADLSSLTAVDFANVKELNFNQNIRRRRIRPTVSSISTTTTENNDDTLRTSSRNLPLAKVNLLNASKFGKSRRVLDTQTTKSTKVRGYRATREPSSTESIASIDLISSTESTRVSPRNRRIIRRFRTTAAPRLATEEILFGSKSIESLNDLQQNKVDEDNDDNFDDSSNEEGENIKLSESNIRENSDVNSFSSNLRGNKKLVNFHNKASIFGKDSGRGKVTAKDIVSTEPHFTSRTRKIVRKILPTQTTTTDTAISEQGTGRRRKIIRRLRPTTILNKVADEYIDNVDKKNLQSSTSSEETKESRKHLFRPKISEDDVSIFLEPSTTSTTENIYSIVYASSTSTEDKLVDSLEDIEEKTELTPIITSTEPIQTTYGSDNNTETTTGRVETEEIGKHIFRPTTTENTLENKSEGDQVDDAPKRPNLTAQRNRYIRYKSTERNVSNNSKGSFRKFNRINGSFNSNTEENIASFEDRKIYRPTLEQQVDSSNRNNNITEEKVEKRKSFNRQRLFSRISRTTNPTSTVSIASTESTPIYSIYTETPTDFTENVTDVLDTSVQASENLTLIRTSEATAIFVDEMHSNNTYEESTIGSTKPNEIEEPSNSNIDTDITYAMSEIPSSTEKLQTTLSSSPRTRNKFRNPKERPSFIRSKLNRTNLKDDTQPLSSTPRYRKFSRVTTSELSSTKETIYTYSYETEDDDEETEDPNTAYTTGYSEMTTILPERFTAEQEDSKDSTTEMDTVNSNILDTTTAEVEVIMTTESSLPNFINEISTGDDNISADNFDTSTINIELKSDPTTTLGLDYINETSTPLLQTTSATISTAVTENTTTQSTERTTAYQRKSTFKSINARPKFSPKKLKDLNIARSTEPSSTKFQPKRFRNRLQDSSTESALISRINGLGTSERTQSRFAKFSPTRRTSTTPSPLNKFLYKYSSTEKYEDNVNNEENVRDSNIEDDKYVEDDIDTEEENSSPQSEIISSILQQSKTTAAKSLNRPYFAKKNTTKIVNKPKIFTSTTLATTVNDALSKIDTEAVKNRNKNLFSKNRKNNNILNTAISTEENNNLPTSTLETEYQTVTDAAVFTEETTNPISSLPETTEFLTTLHHVFAEVDGTTTGMSKQETTTNKIERLIEVNRIVKFETKEAIIKNHTVEVQKSDVIPVLNKIGEVSRVTVIKVVDKDGNVVEKKNDTNNEIKEMNIISPVYIPEAKVETSTADKSSFEEVAKVEEIPAKSVLDKVNLTNIIVAVNKVNHANDSDTNRDDRKIDLFSGVNFSKDINKDRTIEKLDIIEGKSHINVFTPRPLYNTEASTIALEALFKTTENPLEQMNKKFMTSNDELLETDHSKFVNVRVLHPDESVRLEKSNRGDSKVIPIKLLKQDDGEVTLKAQVVEVTPRSFNNMIKIIPIRVEMSRQIVNKLPIFRVEKQNVPPT